MAPIFIAGASRRTRYPLGMDNNQDERIEQQAEYLAGELKKTSRGA